MQLLLKAASLTLLIVFAVFIYIYEGNAHQNKQTKKNYEDGRFLNEQLSECFPIFAWYVKAVLYQKNKSTHVITKPCI